MGIRKERWTFNDRPSHQIRGGAGRPHPAGELEQRQRHAAEHEAEAQQSPVLPPLREAAVWRSVTTDGYTIRWQDEKGYPYDMAEYEVNQFANGL